MNRVLGLLLALSGLTVVGAASAGGPDLRVVVGATMNGKVGIANVGGGPAGASKLTVLCKKIGGGSCAESGRMAPYEDPAFPNQVVVNFGPLAAGKSASHSLAFWGALSWAPGKYRFYLKADAANTVVESSETNNEYTSLLVKP